MTFSNVLAGNAGAVIALEIERQDQFFCSVEVGTVQYLDAHPSIAVGLHGDCEALVVEVLAF